MHPINVLWEPGQLVRLVLRSTLALAGIGMAIGVGSSVLQLLR